MLIKRTFQDLLSTGFQGGTTHLYLIYYSSAYAIALTEICIHFINLISIHSALKAAFIQ